MRPQTHSLSIPGTPGKFLSKVDAVKICRKGPNACREFLTHVCRIDLFANGCNHSGRGHTLRSPIHKPPIVTVSIFLPLKQFERVRQDSLRNVLPRSPLVGPFFRLSKQSNVSRKKPIVACITTRHYSP